MCLDNEFLLRYHNFANIVHEAVHEADSLCIELQLVSGKKNRVQNSTLVLPLFV
jgi:hypothetical protein